MMDAPLTLIYTAGIRGNLDLLPGGPTAVVVSAAIRPDNAEVAEARRRGVPGISAGAAWGSAPPANQ